ncbi:MAG: Tim44 domain-containing protein [Chelatococcus sp.]|jgi:predicted lipid-binding transport protein (Tim44 family)|uniref:Tim44/TimA family putative adaptor protein n=1 Tax=unclassified Chelatococcus TaxID=2638111 RepID=UPI001BCA98F6|nr:MULTISPECIES: Tim44/TimA family putative adaptor protein [unclassified Chelatococcus]CAH1657145.1 putative lipid-binding transport protein (Tim44 family) [Hyphomicrobiales bacterium]MBS7740640.1 Tim44 domain-containing protein [Chelatococcus sp. HY11]MBX3540402.1 Tim44 domain-containing protein [Chelatococcus sp.]MBX3544576.1 Tim44 domain-containing protein [Chelatococcus sp.]MCO5079873.1 Tim44/TimA family putative adaptor protein [Chelatococcus sp.]
MQDGFDVTTIVFLALAVFVIWRLRSVLGQRTGNERPPQDPFARRDPPMKPANGSSNGDNVVRLPGAANDTGSGAEANPNRWKGIAEAGTPLAAGLDAVVRAEPSFNPQEFLSGAKMAYEMIVMAFAQGDRKSLKGLLSKEVFEGFDREIGEREKRGEKIETTFVSIDGADLLAVDLKGKLAQATVRFTSKLITATRDAAGTVVDGSAETVVTVTDVWTFARTLGGRDPNWQLVATEAAQ